MLNRELTVVLTFAVRIAFMPFKSFTGQEALYTDLPADFAVVLYIIITLNTAYKDDLGTWVVSRLRILRHCDLLAFFAALPLDWYVSHSFRILLSIQTLTIESNSFGTHAGLGMHVGSHMNRVYGCA